MLRIHHMNGFLLSVPFMNLQISTVVLMKTVKNGEWRFDLCCISNCTWRSYAWIKLDYTKVSDTNRCVKNRSCQVDVSIQGCPITAVRFGPALGRSCINRVIGTRTCHHSSSNFNILRKRWTKQNENCRCQQNYLQYHKPCRHCIIFRLLYFYCSLSVQLILSEENIKIICGESKNYDNLK